MKQYFLNIYISLDKLGSSLLGLDPDETISSVLGKLKAKKIYRVYPIVWLVNFLFGLVGESDHCVNSVQPSEGLFTSNYNGAVSPENVLKYVIPLQVFGIIVFFNFGTILSYLTIWS